MKNEDTREKTQAGVVVGSVLKAIVLFLKKILKFLSRLFTFFGLWAAVAYCAFGLILYLAFGFNPFDGSLNATLFLAGFAMTLACAVIITGRNIIVKPAKNIVSGYKNPIWQKNENPEKTRIVKVKREKKEPLHERLERERTIPERRERDRTVTERRDYGRPTPEKYEYSRESYERPKVYRSVLEKDTLIHEYGDRFEVYKERNGRYIKERVEYKDYENGL